MAIIHLDRSYRPILCQSADTYVKILKGSNDTHVVIDGSRGLLQLKSRLKSLSEIAVPTLAFPPQLGSTHNKTQGTEHIRQATDFHWSGEAILTHVI